MRTMGLSSMFFRYNPLLIPLALLMDTALPDLGYSPHYLVLSASPHDSADNSAPYRTAVLLHNLLDLLLNNPPELGIYP